MNDTYTLKTEVERGVAAFQNGYHGGLSALPQRISHHLSARLSFTKIPLKLTKPMLTVSFDDVSQSAAIEGASILEQHQSRGTFYITTDLMGRHVSGSMKANAAQIIQLHANKHEIGLHSHAHLPVFSYSKVGLFADLDENKSRLADILNGFEAINYCYPYGVSSLQHKYWLSPHVRSARVLWKDVNKNVIDPHFLKGQMIDSDSISHDTIDNLLTEAKQCNGWLITISHQISNNNRLSTSPETLNSLLKKAIELDFDIVTINQGLDKIQKMNRIERQSHVKL